MKRINKNRNNQLANLNSVGIVIVTLSICAFIWLVYGGVGWILGCRVDLARNIITQALVALLFTFVIWSLITVFNLFSGLGKFLRENAVAFEYLFFGQVILALSSTKEISSRYPLLILCIVLAVILFLFALLSLRADSKNLSTKKWVSGLFMIFILLITTATVGVLLYTKAPEISILRCMK